MVIENSIMLIGMFIKKILQKEKFIEKEYISILMILDVKENGKMIYKMVNLLNHGLIDQNNRVLNNTLKKL